MRTIRIGVAYLAAAAVGALSLLVSIWVAEGFGDLAGSFTFFGLGLAFAAVFAAPVALPAIIYSEWRGVSSWGFFATAGALSALLIYVLIAEFPPRIEDLPETMVFLGASVIAASTYWWFAGRLAGQTHARRSKMSDELA